MLMVFETVIIRAATGWFPKEAWTVSAVPAITAIVMVRWGPWCGIHAALGGIVTVLALKGNGTQFLIYGIGNLAVLEGMPEEASPVAAVGVERSAEIEDISFHHS